MAYWGTFVFQGYPAPTPFCPCCGQLNGAYYPNPYPPYQPAPAGPYQPPYQAAYRFAPAPPPPPHSGPPPVATPPSSYAEPQFDVTGADDWDDIPDEAPTLHMSEEEEDVRFQIATGQAEPAALANILKLVKANTADIKIEIP